jgi:intracellular multiplication protein IcmV
MRLVGTSCQEGSFMAKKRKRVGYFHTLVDIRSWLGVEGIRANAEGIKDTVQGLKNLPISTRVETFENAMTRLGLDEEFIKKRRQQCFYAAWVFFAFSLLLFCYSFYLFLEGHRISSFVSLILTVIAGLYSYLEGFWYFQMTVRQLGCKHKEFIAFITGRK